MAEVSQWRTTPRRPGESRPGNLRTEHHGGCWMSRETNIAIGTENGANPRWPRTNIQLGPVWGATSRSSTLIVYGCIDLRPITTRFQDQQPLVDQPTLDAIVLGHAVQRHPQSLEILSGLLPHFSLLENRPIEPGLQPVTAVHLLRNRRVQSILKPLFNMARTRGSVLV